MRIAVIGAGIVGVAAAHALAERGHEIHVYDRRGDVASDTSASTAGLVAPRHSYAWASPKRLPMLVKSLLGESTSIRVRRGPTPTWCAGRAVHPRVHAVAVARQHVGRTAARPLQPAADGRLAAREGLQYWQTRAGVLYLFHEEPISYG